MNVLVCGTHYGSAYVSALLGTDFFSRWSGLALSDEYSLPSLGLNLVGIFARGSERSNKLAAQASVPLYTDLSALPGGCDIACVAVGDPDAVNICTTLLGRGIHVIAEHPMRHRDAERCLEAADARGVQFHINSHFADLRFPRFFVAACLKRLGGKAPTYIDALGHARTLYSLVELIGRLVRPMTPYVFEPRAPLSRSDRPAVTGSVEGVLGTTAVSIRWLRATSHDDNGSDLVVTHRITTVTPGGTIVLANAFGPVLECAAPFASARGGKGRPASAPLWSSSLGEEPFSFTDYRIDRFLANRSALARLAEDVRAGTPSEFQKGDYLLSVSKIWETLVESNG